MRRRRTYASSRLSRSCSRGASAFSSSTWTLRFPGDVTQRDEAATRSQRREGMAEGVELSSTVLPDARNSINKGLSATGKTVVYHLCVPLMCTTYVYHLCVPLMCTTLRGLRQVRGR